MGTADAAVNWAKKKIGNKTTYKGRCQAFVADAYAAATGKRISAATATAAWKSWGKYTNKTNIPKGAAVYFRGSNANVGHVALCIGNGQIIHNWPDIRISYISNIPNFRGWGWNGNVVLTSDSTSSYSGSTATSSSSTSGSSSTTEDRSSWSENLVSLIGEQTGDRKNVSSSSVQRDNRIVRSGDGTHVVTLEVADSESTSQFSIGETLLSVSWETYLFDQPGKLTFEVLLPEKSDMFFEGSNAVLKIDNEKVFDGYVFTRKITEEGIMTVTVYDRLRYLQNKDTQIFENATAAEIFTKLCNSHKLPFKITSNSTYKTSAVTHDNKTLAAMIKRSLDETLVGTNTYLIVRDNVGTLEMVDIATLTTDILIGDESLLTGFEFESTIDTNTYNYIKLIQENTKTKKRDVYIAMDSKSIYKWGRLQYFQVVDEDANSAQIVTKANQLLSLYNRKTRSLKISSLGDSKVRAGSGIGVSVGALSAEGIAQMQYLFVSACKHNISSGLHTMDLTLEVV